MKKQEFVYNDRVEYYVYDYNGKRVNRVGYVKSFRRVLFASRYFICAADHSREIDVVKPSQIFGLAPKKEHKQNNVDSNGN